MTGLTRIDNLKKKKEKKTIYNKMVTTKINATLRFNLLSAGESVFT